MWVSNPTNESKSEQIENSVHVLAKGLHQGRKNGLSVNAVVDK